VRVCVCERERERERERESRWADGKAIAKLHCTLAESNNTLEEKVHGHEP